MEAISEVAGGIYQAKVGVLKDYDNIWDAEIDRWHQRVDHFSQKAIYAAAQETYTPLDYVLEQYVEKGGILVIGCRSGYKNRCGQAWYYGSAFTEEAAKIFLEKLGVAETYQDVVEAPPGCEIAVRRKGVRKGGTSRIWYFGCKSWRNNSGSGRQSGMIQLL